MADSFTVTEGSSTNLNLAANDTDADDGLDLTSITIVSGPTNGSVVVNADGSVDYTHDGSETIAERCVLQMVNETVHCLESGIVRSARDADVGAE